MIFQYEAITSTGEKKKGTIDALNKDSAILALQRRDLIVERVLEEKEKSQFMSFGFLNSKIKTKDVVVMSRQISTLFEAQVSALKVFTLLSENTQNKGLVKVLNQIVADIQAGMNISGALAKHPEVFSDFYVNMVKAGEESGKLIQVFSYMADYLDRQYQLNSKIKNALVYPAFVVGTFIVVMILMFTVIVPKLQAVILDTGQDINFITKFVFGISNFFTNYWYIIVAILVVLTLYILRLSKSKSGKSYLDKLKISFPIVKNIYSKLYLARIADNMETMLSSGVSIIKSIEITSVIVGNEIYEEILKQVALDVKAGSSFSEALSKHKEIPTIMSGMSRVGEETGSMGKILKTLGVFYTREVNEEIDTMVGLIEPIMIVFLGLGVGLLLASILMPIYNIAKGL